VVPLLHDPEHGPASASAHANKEFLTRLRRSELATFLSTGHRLRFRHHDSPLVSVVIVIHNRADLTFQCLRSLAENADVAFEVIVVDNDSTDETRALLTRIESIEVIRNESNLHFLRGCNQAVPGARGQYVLFLNNDISLLPGSLAAAVRTIESAADIGAVGARLVLPDGTLQEAGSIIWPDGSTLGYGRGDAPLSPPYMFERDVDYCSGAFLLTSRSLFLAGGAFDERFAPAYYEEVDYCVRLRELGKRVVYHPDVVAYHFEFASSQSSEAAIELQRRNRSHFREKHKLFLESHYSVDNRQVLVARHARKDRRRVLVLDDRTPHQQLGSGFPRSRAIIQSMVELGYAVTFYPMTMAHESWPSVYEEIPRTVEVMTGGGIERLESFLRERRGFYDVITISRPHNMESFGRIWKAHPDLLEGVRIAYDAEAVFALREINRHALFGEPLSPTDANELVAAEVELATGVDAVACVSEQEAEHYLSRGVPEVLVLAHAVQAEPTPRDFAARGDLLFVGAIHDEASPNADSLLWFGRKVLPLVREELGGVELHVVGMNASSAVADLAGLGVRLLGPVKDLRPFYDSRRLFVAPTRFGAGLPIKLCEAAAYGLPIVTTSLLTSQLRWRSGVDLLVGDTAEAFARACVQAYRERTTWEMLRTHALAQVERQCSPAAFTRVVARMCEGRPVEASKVTQPVGGCSPRLTL
jgi:GT2 family glycosyltransferase